MTITNLDELHPLYTLCANRDKWESYGRADNAMSAWDGESQEGRNQLPNCWPCRLGDLKKRKEKKVSYRIQYLKQPQKEEIQIIVLHNSISLGLIS